SSGHHSPDGVDSSLYSKAPISQLSLLTPRWSYSVQASGWDPGAPVQPLFRAGLSDLSATVHELPPLSFSSGLLKRCSNPGSTPCAFASGLRSVALGTTFGSGGSQVCNSWTSQFLSMPNLVAYDLSVRIL